MCDMYGHHDPTRTSTFELTREQVLDRMLAIAEIKLKSGWWFDKEPYSLNNQPPKVSLTSDDCGLVFSFLELHI